MKELKKMVRQIHRKVGNWREIQRISEDINQRLAESTLRTLLHAKSCSIETSAKIHELYEHVIKNGEEK